MEQSKGPSRAQFAMDFQKAQFARQTINFENLERRLLFYAILKFNKSCIFIGKLTFRSRQL